MTQWCLPGPEQVEVATGPDRYFPDSRKQIQVSAASGYEYEAVDLSIDEARQLRDFLDAAISECDGR